MTSPTAGVPSVGSLIAEGIANARSRPPSSILVIVLAGAMVVGVLATAGRTAAVEYQVLSTIDAVGTRFILVTDTDGEAGIPPRAVDRVRSLSGVESVIGLGAARDFRNAVFPVSGAPVPVWTVYGTLPPEVILVSGRWPQSGEVVVGPLARNNLGMAMPVGGLRQDVLLLRLRDAPLLDLSVVGEFDARPPFDFLQEGGISVSHQADVLRRLIVIVERPADVETTLPAIRYVLGAVQPDSVSVQGSEDFARLRQAVAGELGTFSRSAITGVLALGLLLIGFVVFATVTLGRRDFGRRRALGASRSAIVLLVVCQTLAAALVGAALGLGLGLAIALRLAGSLPDWGFNIGVTVLAIVTAFVAAIPPALIAAWRDPIRILRVP